MPCGSTARATSVPASALTQDITVPSPPQAKTSSTPASTACSVWPRPGSSAVVSYHCGAGQPAAVEGVVDGPAQLVEIVDLHRVDHHRGAQPAVAARGSPVLSSIHGASVQHPDGFSDPASGSRRKCHRQVSTAGPTRQAAARSASLHPPAQIVEVDARPR